MSYQISVDMTSLDQAGEMLESIASTLLDTVGDSMDQLGQDILDMSEQIVPVRTGYLKSCLGYDQPSSLEIIMKDTAPYAAYVEWGTSKMAPRYYLTDAINEYLPDFVQQLADAIAALFGTP